jgi:hypothetical protein
MPVFVFELSLKLVPRKRNERVRTSAVQEIRLQNYLLGESFLLVLVKH